MDDQREELAKLGLMELGKTRQQDRTYQVLQDMGYNTQQIVNAIGIAQNAASTLPPTYHTSNFAPHDWVVLAVLKVLYKKPQCGEIF